MWRLVLSDSTVKRSPRNSVRWASKAARRTGSRATAIAEAAARGEELGVMRSSRGVDGSGGRLTGPDPVGAGCDPVGVLVAAAGPIPPCQHAGGVQGRRAGGLARLHVTRPGLVWFDVDGQAGEASRWLTLYAARVTEPNLRARDEFL